MPFKSKAQQRWAFSTGQKFAKRWAHETSHGAKGGSKKSQKAFRSLPNHVKKGRKR